MLDVYLPLRALYHVAIADAVADIRNLKRGSFALLLQVVVRQPETKSNSAKQRLSENARNNYAAGRLHRKKHAATADGSVIGIERQRQFGSLQPDRALECGHVTVVLGLIRRGRRAVGVHTLRLDAAAYTPVAKRGGVKQRNAMKIKMQRGTRAHT
jgi:hypothetical protein